MSNQAPARTKRYESVTILYAIGRNQPGAILQRKIKGEWKDYLIDGKPVVNPIDVNTLPPGWYRLREK